MLEPSLPPQSHDGCPDWPDQLKVIAVPLPPLAASVDALVAKVAVAELPEQVPAVGAVAAFPPMLRPEAVPVMFVPTSAEGVPKFGVTNVGLLAKTLAPVPVLSVSKAARLADDGVAKNVAAPVANPETPVEIGSPVQLVNVPDAGVPSAGVTRVGLVAKTSAPEPVSSVTAEAKFAELGVAKNVATPVPSPDTPVEIGKPVQFVNVPEVGVPKIGETKVGVFANTLAPVPVLSVSNAAKLAEDGVPKNVAAPDAKPETPVEIGRPVQLVSVPEVGVPSTGVTNVGDVNVPVLTVGLDSVGEIM